MSLFQSKTVQTNLTTFQILEINRERRKKKKEKLQQNAACHEDSVLLKERRRNKNAENKTKQKVLIIIMLKNYQRETTLLLKTTAEPYFKTAEMCLSSTCSYIRGPTTLKSALFITLFFVKFRHCMQNNSPQGMSEQPLVRLIKWNRCREMYSPM